MYSTRLYPTSLWGSGSWPSRTFSSGGTLEWHVSVHIFFISQASEVSSNFECGARNIPVISFLPAAKPTGLVEADCSS